VIDQHLTNPPLYRTVAGVTRQINLYEAKTQLSRLVDEAAAGDTIVIAKGGKPMAQLGPVGAGLDGPRKLGQLAEHSRQVDWARWWREWKAADREIETDFETSVRAPVPRGYRRRHRTAR
jgi:antitoxin (DNA-binding transcriptional repressor) of toxin-antitoxin stability system